MDAKRMNRVVSDASRSLGHMRRTAYPRVWPYRTTFNTGKLIPVYARKVEPNQNISLKGDTFIRSITPLGATMDNAYLDMFFFYVPSRLLWDHFEDYITGQAGKPYNKDVTYIKPKIKFRRSKLVDDAQVDVPLPEIHSFMDYLPQACDIVAFQKIEEAGGEAGGDFADIDALFPRAYVKIYNDWFRPEFLEEPLELYTGDNDEFADEFAFDLTKASSLLTASKLHNIFTDATPEPSMGADVLIPMDDLEVGFFGSADATVSSGSQAGITGSNDIENDVFKSLKMNGSVTGVSGNDVIARNVSNTIRMLNVAYKTQILLDKDMNFGTRYTESVRSHFDLQLSDVRAARSEYLGWRRIGMNTYQITNTAESASSALGNVGGQSTIADAGAHFFSHAFPEHGIVFGIAVLRPNWSIGSGIHPQYQEFDRFEEHWPEFNHIGRVPLYTRNLVFQNSDDVFGYIPYREHERSAYGINSGMFRAGLAGSYAYLTYQDVYWSNDGIDAPTLSKEWLAQGREQVDNTLIDQNGPQFYGFFKFYEENTLLLDPTSNLKLRM